tara:strand:- start:450 stop:1136 length:687 start_codon:yes stop_codon:yes gene_type:complete
MYGPKLVRLPGDATLAAFLCFKKDPLVERVIQSQQHDFSFLDIGANQGVFSLIAAEHRLCHRVYAFEPSPSVFKNLVTNIELNRASITPFCVAVTKGISTPDLNIHPHWSGRSSLESGRLNSRKITVLGIGHEVLSKCEGTRFVVKIDVEGHEPTVIHELAVSTIWTRISDIVLEQHNYHQERENLVDMQMSDLGFAPVAIDGDSSKADIHYQRVLAPAGRDPIAAPV